MRLYFGDPCPAFENRICGLDVHNSLNCCTYCRTCRAKFLDGVECGYSVKPNTVPKFKEGEEVYRFFHLDSFNIAKIRKVEWNRHVGWQYYMSRERTPYEEDRLFKSRKEIETYIIEKHAKHLMNELMDFSKRYHVPLENLKHKLIE